MKSKDLGSGRKESHKIQKKSKFLYGPYSRRFTIANPFGSLTCHHLYHSLILISLPSRSIAAAVHIFCFRQCAFEQSCQFNGILTVIFVLGLF
jgi:hypothetical protein